MRGKTINNSVLAALLLAAIGLSLTSNMMMLLSVEKEPLSATGFGVEQAAGEANVTLAVEVSINLMQSSIDFGNIALGASNATLPLISTGPFPFVIRNVGSIDCNISMSVDNNDDLWDVMPSPSEYFLYNVSANATGATYVFGAGSNETDKLVQVPKTIGYPLAAPVANLVSNLSQTDTENTIDININITVPPAEPAGAKGATILFQAAQS